MGGRPARNQLTFIPRERASPTCWPGSTPFIQSAGLGRWQTVADVIEFLLSDRAT
jgi:hypothetical protein